MGLSKIELENNMIKIGNKICGELEKKLNPLFIKRIRDLNVGHIVQYFRNIKERKEAIVPVDMSEENGEVFELILIDEENDYHIVQYF